MRVYLRGTEKELQIAWIGQSCPQAEMQRVGLLSIGSPALQGPQRPRWQLQAGL